MKRVLSLMIALAMAITLLSGCGLTNKLTAFGLYSRAVRTIREAGGFEIDSTVSVSFDEDILAGMGLSMQVNIKQNGKNSRSELKVLGGTAAVTTIIGNDVYVEAVGSKHRYALSEDDSAEKSKGNADISVLPEIAKEVFENLEVTENAKGGKSITVSLDSETLYGLVTEMTGGGLDSLEGISLDNAEVTMNFDENNDIDTMQIACDVSYNVLGLFELAGRMDAEYSFVNLGTAPEVNAPDDAEEYEFAGEYEG